MSEEIIASTAVGTDAASTLRTLEVPTLSNEIIPIDLDELFIDPEEDNVTPIAELLDNEKNPVLFWVRLVEEMWRLNKWTLAFELIERGLTAFGRDNKNHVPLLCMQATYNVALARKAPREILSNLRESTGKGAPLVRSTNLNHPESKNPNPNAPPRTKEDYWNAAAASLNRAERIDSKDRRVMDAKASLLLARGKMDEASRIFDSILATEPTHLYALTGRARILFARRSFRLALKCYQTILSHSPTFLPDPRVGMGLCFSMLGEKERARKAWERSIEVHPTDSSNSALLLLGLSFLNESRNPTHGGGEEGRASAYEKGMMYIQKAWKKDNTVASAAGPLCLHFLTTNQYETAIKVAERMIQFADSRVSISDGHLYAARAMHAQNSPQAMNEYDAALKAYPEQLLALLASAQTLTEYDHFPAAMNLYETVIRRQPKCIEALVALAAIHTHLAFTSLTAADCSSERKKAQALYDDVLRLFASGKDSMAGDTEVNKAVAKSARIREIAQDPYLFIEIARLWSDDASLERSLVAYKEALRIYEEELEEEVPPQLLSNIGVLEYHKGDLESAQERFEQAMAATGDKINESGRTDKLEAVFIALGYNLGTVYEDLKEFDKAKVVYEQILQQHPEFVDAKARLALMAMSSKEGTRLLNLDHAHELIKETLSSQPRNPELRALYTYFLVETNSMKMARDFAITTLKEHSRYDGFALCASAMIYYNEARENKDTSKEAAKDRQNRFVKAAEYYDTALKRDPYCTFAAQGLAISIAEGTIGVGVEATATAPALTESAAKGKNARDALTILTKVRESINHGSVYVNMGHCYFAREEFDRAIECYETASRRYFNGKNVPTLLYLARSWYHKGNKDLSFSDLRQSLKSAKEALALQPKDLAIIFNVAIVQQKAVEVLFELAPNRRTVTDINLALADGEEAQKLFEQLAADKAVNIPYERDIPRHRQQYGNSLLKRGPDVISAQEAYEATEQAKLDRAKQARDLERQRAAEAEAVRLAEVTRQAEILAEQRRAMREEAAQWAISKAFADSDDEGEKDKRRREKGTKKRKTKIKEDDASSGDEEEQDKTSRKHKKSRVKSLAEGTTSDGGEGTDPMDVDDDEPVLAKRRGRAGKVFKSAEFIEDSEESEADE